MMFLLTKIDTKLFNLVSWFVRRWVARREFKKHKVDFIIRVEWLNFAACIVWATVVPSALYLVAGNGIGAGIHFLLWSVLSASDYFSIQITTYKLKPLHDWLFSMREDPRIYEMEKESLEKAFEESRPRRIKQHLFLLAVLALCFAITYISGMDSANAFVMQYLTFTTAVSALKHYTLYVFDFDPPKKRKKASQSISELVARLWGEFIGGFNPLPAPA